VSPRYRRGSSSNSEPEAYQRNGGRWFDASAHSQGLLHIDLRLADGSACSARVATDLHLLHLTCGGCTADWVGEDRAHCGRCHVTYDSITLFDAHHSIRSCRRPQVLALVSTRGASAEHRLFGSVRPVDPSPRCVPDGIGVVPFVVRNGGYRWGQGPMRSSMEFPPDVTGQDADTGPTRVPHFRRSSKLPAGPERHGSCSGMTRKLREGDFGQAFFVTGSVPGAIPGGTEEVVVAGQLGRIRCRSVGPPDRLVFVAILAGWDCDLLGCMVIDESAVGGFERVYAAPLLSARVDALELRRERAEGQALAAPGVSGSRTRPSTPTLRIHAARSYSLISPPSTGRRLIRRPARYGAGRSGRGG
jgi:hypothetical protein